MTSIIEATIIAAILAAVIFVPSPGQIEFEQYCYEEDYYPPECANVPERDNN